MKRMLLPAVLLLLAAAPSYGIDFDLSFERLAEAFQLLPDADRGSVDEVIKLVRKGESAEALRRLQDLNQTSPQNSSLRVLTAYTMLQLGNVLGAFDEAGKAHEASNGNSYKCWFYAKVALLSGKPDVCKRELGHLKKVGDMPREAKSIEAQLKKKG